ncbi:MAG: monomethylamine:corrinoid methyltransferase [Chloroflexi bacterium]|nr:monomethylamine:corrinoid methyltransferase [Chloroflexota bacterium]
MLSFLEIAKRSETGPMAIADELGMKIAGIVTGLAKKYDIAYDPEVRVNTDDDLADRVWQAGRDLILEIGLYSINSRRQILFSEREVDEGLAAVRPEFTAGEGLDTALVYRRDVEDNRPPVIFGGPFNADVHQDMFVRLNEAFAGEPLIDLLLLPGYLKELDGIMIRPNSGLSTRAAMFYGRWAREAISRAGRPGLPIVGHAVMALNEVSSANEEWGLRSCDPRAFALISELQVDDVTLTRLAHYQAIGAPIYTSATPLIGGYGGGPVGTAIIGVAGHIGSVMLGSHVMHLGPQHIKYKQQTNAMSLWLGSVVKQAAARNSKMINTTSVTTSGRPGSMQYIYEFSALVLSVVPSGSNLTGPRPAEPLGWNNVSPLMCRLFAEVGHAATKIDRKEANRIADTLHEKYKDKIELKDAPKGLPFEKMYDVNTLQPNDEHWALYEKGKSELKELGVPLE